MNSTLIILGAGCSFKSGYPLASNSFPRLAEFRDSLSDRDDATKLSRFVTQTLDLVEKLRKQGESVETLDTLHPKDLGCCTLFCKPSRRNSYHRVFLSPC